MRSVHFLEEEKRLVSWFVLRVKQKKCGPSSENIGRNPFLTEHMDLEEVWSSSTGATFEGIVEKETYLNSLGEIEEEDTFPPPPPSLTQKGASSTITHVDMLPPRATKQGGGLEGIFEEAYTDTFSRSTASSNERLKYMVSFNAGGTQQASDNAMFQKRDEYQGWNVRMKQGLPFMVPTERGEQEVLTYGKDRASQVPSLMKIPQRAGSMKAGAVEKRDVNMGKLSNGVSRSVLASDVHAGGGGGIHDLNIGKGKVSTVRVSSSVPKALSTPITRDDSLAIRHKDGGGIGTFLLHAGRVPSNAHVSEKGKDRTARKAFGKQGMNARMPLLRAMAMGGTDSLPAKEGGHDLTSLYSKAVRIAAAHLSTADSWNSKDAEREVGLALKSMVRPSVTDADTRRQDSRASRMPAQEASLLVQASQWEAERGRDRKSDSTSHSAVDRLSNLFRGILLHFPKPLHSEHIYIAHPSIPEEGRPVRKGLSDKLVAPLMPAARIASGDRIVQNFMSDTRRNNSLSSLLPLLHSTIQKFFTHKSETTTRAPQPTQNNYYLSSNEIPHEKRSLNREDKLHTAREPLKSAAERVNMFTAENSDSSRKKADVRDGNVHVRAGTLPSSLSQGTALMPDRRGKRHTD